MAQIIVPSVFHTPVNTGATPTQGLNSCIATIQEVVFQVIRTAMPITTLFTPELKIDLSLFVKDQELFYKIAALIEPLSKAESVDLEMVQKTFQDSNLLPEIKAMFKDPTPYLGGLYKACWDVLKQPSVTNDLKPALEGRIYTLKNALIAQQTPSVIQKSQNQNKISIQTEESIKKEGESFIRESIALYLKIFQNSQKTPFKEELISVAKQLIPFVQKVTRIYLKENGKNCPDNPLTFRNPTGYNYHGLVAATIMEACLSALGYSTRLLSRGDLEPKVTLAQTHNITEVQGPGGQTYLVDPSYLQFHKDVCLGDAQLPNAPILVLDETEVDDYIEKQIMAHWKSNLQRVEQNDETAIEKLKKNDQILSLVTKTLPSIHQENIPRDVEDWVRKSFKRVWGFSGYTPVFSDLGFEDIFYGTNEKKDTYELIKSMNFTSLTHHSSFAEIEAQLNECLNNPALQRKNDEKALSLISKLPRLKRNPYEVLFDIDPRLVGTKKIDLSLNAYFRHLRQIINPGGKNFKVIYGCSGADCMSVLLATDAQELILVDLTQTSLDEFKKAFDQFKTAIHQLNTQSISNILEKLEKDSSFVSTRSRYLGSMSEYRGNDQHFMKDLALKICADLFAMGANLKDAALSTVEGGVQFEFSWKYHGAESARKRRVIFLTADITKPQQYPPFLQKKIKEGFDVFYMKGAFFAPISYPQFLPSLASALNPGGWLMTTDKTMWMDTVDPTHCLQQNRLQFVLQNPETKRVLENVMASPFDPLFIVPSLERFPLPELRPYRQVGSDLTYWAILNLRQKI